MDKQNMCIQEQGTVNPGLIAVLVESYMYPGTKTNVPLNNASLINLIMTIKVELKVRCTCTWEVQMYGKGFQSGMIKQTCLPNTGNRGNTLLQLADAPWANRQRSRTVHCPQTLHLRIPRLGQYPQPRAASSCTRALNSH